jgi:hypothetical protein
MEDLRVFLMNRLDEDMCIGEVLSFLRESLVI